MNLIGVGAKSNLWSNRQLVRQGRAFKPPIQSTILQGGIRRLTDRSRRSVLVDRLEDILDLFD